VSDAVALLAVIFENGHRVAIPKVQIDVPVVETPVRLLLAILGDKRSGIARAAVGGHPPVLTGARLVAEIEF
jgi:hypothetical protein